MHIIIVPFSTLYFLIRAIHHLFVFTFRLRRTINVTIENKAEESDSEWQNLQNVPEEVSINKLKN